MELLNWYHMIAFCNKLSLADGKDPVYDGINWSSLAYSSIPKSSNSTWNAATMDMSKNGYRLPTEMEWMWAAMGADKGKPGQKNTSGYLKDFAGPSGGNRVDYAWISGNSNRTTHEVRQKLPNELGLYDMTGNVYEWCWDLKADPYINTDIPDGTVIDYKGLDSGNYRVIKGEHYNPTGQNGYIITAPAIHWGRFPYVMIGSNGFRVMCR